VFVIVIVALPFNGHAFVSVGNDEKHAALPVNTNDNDFGVNAVLGLGSDVPGCAGNAEHEPPNTGCGVTDKFVNKCVAAFKPVCNTSVNGFVDGYDTNPTAPPHEPIPVEAIGVLLGRMIVKNACSVVSPEVPPETRT
jgi:hypothetical protein